MPCTTWEKARILSELHWTWSVALKQRRVCLVMQKSAPFRTDILRWEQTFMETRNVDYRGGKGRPNIKLSPKYITQQHKVHIETLSHYNSIMSLLICIKKNFKKSVKLSREKQVQFESYFETPCRAWSHSMKSLIQDLFSGKRVAQMGLSHPLSAEIKSIGSWSFSSSVELAISLLSFSFGYSRLQVIVLYLSVFQIWNVWDREDERIRDEVNSEYLRPLLCFFFSSSSSKM